jgi:hypothetical protein
VGDAAALWLSCLGRLAGRAAHELKNPLNGLALNLEVVRSRSARAGADASALAPFAAAAAGELERTIPLVEALLALARPLPIPVDLRTAIEPLAVLYGAIAVAGGGSLSLEHESEQMFVGLDGNAVRALVAEALDVTIGNNLEVSARVGYSDAGSMLSLRMIGGAGRPISAKIERLAMDQQVRISSDEDETALLFPALARAGVDSNT